MEERADFSSVILFDEEILRQGDNGREKMAKVRLKRIIQSVVTGCLSVAVPIWFGNACGGFEIIGFLYTGAVLAFIVPLLMTVSFVRKAITARYMEYVVTDRNVVTYENGKYTTYAYYGVDEAYVNGPEGTMNADVEVVFRGDAVNGSSYHRKRNGSYDIVLDSVDDPWELYNYIMDQAKRGIFAEESGGNDLPEEYTGEDL